jgi:hypothetical protein
MGGENDYRRDADGIVKTNDMRRLDDGKDPGKRTRTQQGPSYTGGVGGPYVDHGAACAGVDGDPSAFFRQESATG